MINTEQPVIAIYTRTASPQQPHACRALEKQKQICLEYLNGRYGEDGYDYKIYDEGSASGNLGLYDPAKPGQAHRPVLTRLVEDAKKGKIQAIAVASMDRLSRSLALTTWLIDEVLEKHGIRLIDAATVHLDSGDRKPELREDERPVSLPQMVAEILRAEHIRTIRMMLENRRE
mgnify:CR=1 FL=1